MRAELLGETRCAAVQALGEHEDAVVLDMLAHGGRDAVHVAGVGEQRQCAAAGDLGDLPQALALAHGELVRPPRVSGGVLEHEDRLTTVVERRRKTCSRASTSPVIPVISRK